MLSYLSARILESHWKVEMAKKWETLQPHDDQVMHKFFYSMIEQT